MGDIRDQLQSLTGAELVASQLSAAGGKAFVSMNAKPTQMDLNDVTQFWQSVHVPSYGMPIAGSGKTATGTDSNPIALTLDTNQTAYITAMSVSNTNGTDAATVSITVGNAIAFIQSVPPNESVVVVGAGSGAMPPFYLVNGLDVGISATGTTPGDVSFILAYGLSAQG